MSKKIGVPVMILHEAVGVEVRVELQSGESYKGKVVSIEDSMNVQLTQATYTSRNGKTETAVDEVYLRGASIVFFGLPEALKLSQVALCGSVAEAASAAAPKEGKGNGFKPPSSSARNKRPRED